MENSVLLLDSDDYNLEVLSEYLADQPYNLVCAQTGKQAWDLLTANPQDFILMVLDANLSDMDGLELLKRIKSNNQLRTRPVIMQTTHANPVAIEQGIDAGAKYYIVKPFTKVRLCSLIRSALEEYSHFFALQNELNKGMLGLLLMQKAEFKFQKLSDADRLGLTLARACYDPNRVILGLSEMLINAVEHGNLEIGYDLKSKLIEQERWAVEVQARLEQEKYKQRWVNVEFLRTEQCIKITITDDGYGFNWKDYLKFDPKHALDGHGRGIITAKKFCFDDVEFNEKGNQVLLTLYPSK